MTKDPYAPPYSDPEVPYQRMPATQQVPAEEVIFEGTVWSCGRPLCCCLAPLCCHTDKWCITNRRIDITYGCCGNEMDTLDIRRITDLHFHRNIWQCCCDRGTIIIYSDDNTSPRLEITTFGMKQVFIQLKDAWSRAKIATAVDIG